MTKKMLLVFAHPDDESFACGLTVPKYAKAGWDIRLICATMGQAGTSYGYDNISPQDLGFVRKQETEEAARILGISDINFLGYQDGKLNSLEYGELEDVIYKKMIELAPSVVITWDRDGLTGHPDHIKISFAATYAFQKYARDLDQITNKLEGIKQHDPQIKVNKFFKQYNFNFKHENFVAAVKSRLVPKLYYATIPSSIVAYLQKNRILEKDPYGRNITGTADDLVSTVITASKFSRIKAEALQKHATQKISVDKFMSLRNNPLLSQEFYICRMQGSAESFIGKNDSVSNRL